MKMYYTDETKKFICVEDEEGNYLKWMHSDSQFQYIRAYGKVDNRSFRGLALTWQTKGRGRASEATLEKVFQIEDYFYHNEVKE
jgi:hypothetical protein